MESYYKLLGIEPDADERQLKAGYFRTIRRYSPEEDPEMFKRVRQAYELLQNPRKRKEYDVTLTLEPIFQNAYRRVLELMKEGEYEEAIQCCKEVLSTVNLELFQLLLAKLYILNENAGKAVKRLEELAEGKPEDRRYRKLLAWSYLKRGWKKKALSLCMKLEASGCCDWDFRLLHGAVLSQLEGSEETCGMLWRMFEDSSFSLEAADMDMVREAWGIICDSAEDFPPEYGKELIQILVRFEGESEDFPEDMVEILQYSLLGFFASPTRKYLSFAVVQLGLLAERLKDYRDRGYCSERDSWMLSAVEEKLESIRLNRDGRLQKDILQNSDCIYMYGMASGLEQRKGNETWGEDYLTPELKVSFLCAQMDFIKALPGVKKSFEIIKNEYPVYAEALGGFLDEILTCSSRAFLLNKYEKRIKRIMEDIEPFWGEMEDYSSEEPYRRTSPKIGRNAPCPCGSGKKYKNCCG